MAKNVPAVRSSRSLAGWPPFREFDDLHERFNQLVNTVFGSPVAGSVLGWTPPADFTETEDAYLLEVELPGVKREDITVEATGNSVAISGELCSQEERTGLVRSHTRHSGRFEYRTSLPTEANPDQISAELADGVLTVRVPKSEAAKPRRIEIISR
ncbi:MAG TPA: Hsp20/alpha crystallin family protein [Kineosporiaceae bacterium]